MKLIVTEMKLIRLPPPIHVSPINPARDKPYSTFDTFASLCGVSGPARAGTYRSLTVDEEVSCYIKAAQTGEGFQAFWNQYKNKLPRLAQLVRRFNVVPSTSVASEAAFSIAGYVHRKQRSSLSSTSIRYSMVLKDRHLLEKIKPRI